jgi:hypothetical protein
MNARFRSLLLFFTSLLVCSPGVRAQDIVASSGREQTPPANVAVVEGSVSLDREDRTETAVPNVPMIPGDRIRTDTGRAEVLFPDGTALDLDEFTSVELQSSTLLRLTAGHILLTVSGASNPNAAVQYQVDTPVASATTNGPGEYRIAVDVNATETLAELAVFRGRATLATERTSMPLRAGQRSVASDNTSPSYPETFNSARFDAFDQWTAMQRTQRLGSASAQYLPPDLRMYGGAFDQYGAWQYDQSYGYVWYPTVAANWQPYYYGYWAPMPVYGWTWVGVDRWSWPTHHYGRWGYANSRWFWVPDRHWSAAWVSWGAAPGYVGWCPLGIDNRPVFGFSVAAGGGYGGYGGWVVLPRTHFGGPAYYAHRYAVPVRSLPPSTRFIARSAAPVPVPVSGGPGRAVPRADGGRLTTADGRTYAVPRGRVTSPRGIDGARSETLAPGSAVNAPVGSLTPGMPVPGTGGAAQAIDPFAVRRRGYGASGQTNPHEEVGAVPRRPSTLPQPVIPPPAGRQPATVPGGGAPGQPVTTPDGRSPGQPATVPPFMRRAPWSGGQPATVPPPPSSSIGPAVGATPGNDVAIPRAWGGGMRSPGSITPPPADAGPAQPAPGAMRAYPRVERPPARGNAANAPAASAPAQGSAPSGQASAAAGQSSQSGGSSNQSGRSSSQSGNGSSGSGSGRHEAGSRRPR